MAQTSVFKEGDSIILVDARGRFYLRTLQPGKVERLREHVVDHDKIIGMNEGLIVSKTERDFLSAYRPTLAEFLLKIPRQTQIIYPKDAAFILMLADVFPGAKVVEAGMGSGALTIALLRAVGEHGEVISYEVNENFSRLALKNVRRFLGECPNLTVKGKDIYSEVDERDVDRVIIDLTQPWLVVPQAALCLKNGGIFLSFSPNITQTQRTVDALRDQGEFHLKGTVEVLIREWVVEGRVLRPLQRMVAHTGFITVARKREGYRGREGGEP